MVIIYTAAVLCIVCRHHLLTNLPLLFASYFINLRFYLYIIKVIITVFIIATNIYFKTNIIYKDIRIFKTPVISSSSVHHRRPFQKQFGCYCVDHSPFQLESSLSSLQLILRHDQSITTTVTEHRPISTFSLRSSLSMITLFQITCRQDTQIIAVRLCFSLRPSNTTEILKYFC